ncbi:putative C6 transcription factor [Aspergillus ellipticus CBS 707.79]|uniref:Putative C6 transcription factor n=1 Tax=Aspergillus ellipticus CBS 707.79 TaxID=1448320 RepID=A0A319DHD7_9EURO|nr:putative C6 transcription factor [Aspergillus ellipticus CBS 707.79]
MERFQVTSTYGQACTNCYKAKCRCVRPSGGTCERCLRLKKRCQPSDSLRRRHAQMGEESDARIARLEDRMDGLVSAMQSFIGSPSAHPSSINVLQSLNGNHTSSSVSSSSDPLANSRSTNPGFSGGPTVTTNSISTLSPNKNPPFLSNPYPLSPYAPLLYEADDRLNFFRCRMLPYFPFVDLAPNMTSRYLRQNRPILFQAIQTVTTFSAKERLPQVEELKHLLFSSALLQVQSNIDLLLGLLTYIAWSTDAFLGRADLVSRLMMLAISLVYDLRLFKQSSLDVQLMMTITQGRAEEGNQSINDETPYGLLERQRAVLACFVLSSNISSHLGRQDAIRWTPQMEESLRSIALTKSCPADELFVYQVRLQLLKQKADAVRQQDETDHDRTGTAPMAASAPRLLYVKALRGQLHELMYSFPPELCQIDILNAHAQYVDLYINQLAYSINKSPPLDVSRHGGGLLGFELLECLWQSVQNIKLWLDNFYRIPASNLVGQPFHFWSHMVLSITLLKYLSTLRDPEWDFQAVRGTVNLISTMDCMLERLDLCSSKEPELQCNDHLLHYLSKLLARCRAWAEARWNMTASSPLQDNRPCSDTAPHNYHIPDLDQIVWMQSMDLGDDKWFDDVLSIPSTFE